MATLKDMQIVQAVSTRVSVACHCDTENRNYHNRAIPRTLTLIIIIFNSTKLFRESGAIFIQDK